MSRTTADIMFKVDPGKTDGGKPAFEFVTARDVELKESWFRDSIASNPELVILPCEKANLTDEPWYFWRREFTVKSPRGKAVGKIDVLLISETGRIGIVETKLSYNPEKRRDVLAQVLDYAVHLTEMNLKDMPKIPIDENNEPITSLDEMALHLSDGDFLIIVAGDDLDDRAVRLSQALLGEQIINPWDLAMIDLALYSQSENTIGSELIIVPTLRRAIISEPRHIVRVVVEGEEPKAQIRIERPVDDGSGKVGRRSVREYWDVDRFFKELEESDRTKEWKEFGNKLHELSIRFPDTAASFGTGKRGSLTLKRLNKGLIEYFIYGAVRFRKKKFKPALGRQLGSEYEKELTALFPKQIGANYPIVWEKEVIPFIDKILKLIESLLVRADQEDIE